MVTHHSGDSDEEGKNGNDDHDGNDDNDGSKQDIDRTRKAQRSVPKFTQAYPGRAKAGLECTLSS